ncbi:MAG: AMP-binding protein [Alphaproteobacteria bacterium]
MVPRNISRDPIALTKALDRDDLAFVQATPSTWRGLVEAGWRSRGAAILCGGEALPPHLAHRLLEQNADVWNVYGPTETTIWSTAAKLVDAITIGRPLANTRVYVLGEDGNPVRPGESGEIYIGGAGVARGYWNRPKLTAERFIASPFVEGERLYRTGDLGRMLENGEIAFIGRNDTQVKVRGARVELGEVEAVLAQDSNVAQCAVVTQSDASGADRLVAYVVASGAKATPQGLRRRLTERLPDYMIPDLVVIRERFPLTPNGKIDRGLLSTPAEAIAGETIPLATMWSNALRRYGRMRSARPASIATRVSSILAETRC